MAHVYHWKHGWIPLDHVAALSKAKGNHEAARRYLEAAHGKDVGIKSRRDVANAALHLHEVPEHDRSDAAKQVKAAAVKHDAQDLLPGGDWQKLKNGNRYRETNQGITVQADDRTVHILGTSVQAHRTAMKLATQDIRNLHGAARKSKDDKWTGTIKINPDGTYSGPKAWALGL